MQPGPLELLEASLRHSRCLLAKLEAERSGIDKQIAEVREHIQRLESETRRPDMNGTGAKGRRRKGENTRLVADLFDGNTDGGFTKKEISEKTGLPFSSVQAVLDREKDNYTEGQDGLWRRKKQSGQ